MKKVLHIPNYFPPNIGGIEQTAQDIVDCLRGTYEQQVICFNHEKGTVIEFIDDVKVTRVGYFKKVASQALSFSYKKVLKKIIQEFQPDYIHFHSPNPLIAIYLLKCHFKGKLIVHWHADIVKQKYIKIFFNRIQRKLLLRADVVIATSPNYIDFSTDLQAVKEKCIVIPSTINENRMQITSETIASANKIRALETRRLVFFIGRHIEYKGLKYLIEAAKLLGDDYRVLIAGSGPLTPKLITMASSNVTFLGKITDDEYKAYLLATDIFAFPSITKNEAFGLSLAEALFYGKPAVTFEIVGSGVNYVNLAGFTGLMVANKDVCAYASAIRQLEDKALYERLSKNAKKRTTELFLMGAFKENLKKIYPEY